GKTIAHSMRVDDGCDRLALYDLARATDRLVDAVGCVSIASWSPRGDALAVYGEDQPVALWKPALQQLGVVGAADGNVVGLGVSEKGSVAWASDGPSGPTAIWRASPGEKPIAMLRPFAPDPSWIPRIEAIPPGSPIHVYHRSCGTTDSRGPALIWIPCS